jgi:hypothetical protein
MSGGKVWREACACLLLNKTREGIPRGTRSRLKGMGKRLDASFEYAIMNYLKFQTLGPFTFF